MRPSQPTAWAGRGRYAGGQNRGALEASADSALRFDCAFARLAGIARVVERFDASANEHAGAGRSAFAHPGRERRSVVESKGDVGRAVRLIDAFQERGRVPRGATGLDLTIGVGAKTAVDEGRGEGGEQQRAKARRPALLSDQK